MKSRSLPAVSIVAAAALTPPAVGQTLEWGRQLGTSSDDRVKALTADGLGGVFVAGHTSGSLFQPNVGNDDVLLFRYDGLGNQVWGRQLGLNHFDRAEALAIDGSGGVYVVGDTHNSLFAGNAGQSDVFVARYSGTGTLIWGRQFGTMAFDFGRALAPDAAGGAFLAGFTGGSLFGPFGGTWDAFLARYDSDGTQLWGRQLGTSVLEFGRALAPDGTGGAYLGGGRFVWRHNGAGDLLWTISLTADAYALAADGAGGVYVAGYGSSTACCSSDVALARYDGKGNLLWLRQFGTSEDDEAYALASDAGGGAFIAGYTKGSLFGTNPSPGPNGEDVFLARYSAAGDPIWARQFGTAQRDWAFALAPVATGSAFVAGVTSGWLYGPNAGPWDAFIARFRTCYPDCDSSGTLNVNDYICFQTKFALGDPYADCDGSGLRNVNDYICFQTKFALGCP